jgi:hypothetical protein
MSPSPTAMSCRREEKWPEILRPESPSGRREGAVAVIRGMNDTSTKDPCVEVSIATLEFGPVVPKYPFFERAVCEWMIATAGLASRPPSSRTARNVSRAMENCPLGATRNCPLLG